MDESKYAANDSRSFENIGELVSELSEDYREVLLMRFISGHSLNEIANKLNIPLGTVKSRLHNGLNKLKNIRK